MASYQSNSLAEFEPFFAGDPKGPYLVQAMFTGTNYTTTPTPPDPMMTELLRAENYVNFNSDRTRAGIAHKPNDVHQDITDLIITTALYHRSVDKTSLASATIKKILDMLPTQIENAFNAKRNDCKELKSSLDKTDFYERYNFLNTSSEILLTCVYRLIDMALYFCRADIPFDLSSKDINHNSMNEHLKNILNLQSGGGTGGVIMCGLIDNLMKDYENLKFHTDTAKMLKSLDVPLDPTINPSFQTEFTRNMTIGLSNIVSDMINKLKEEYGERLKNVDDNTVGNSGRETAKKFFEQYHQYYRRFLTENIIRAFTDVLRKHIMKKGNVAHQTLENPNSWELFEKVYKNWASTSRDAREFYRQNIALFVRDDAGDLYDASLPISLRNQSINSEWIRMTEDEILNLFTSGMDLTPFRKDLRLNLMKAKPGINENVLFGENLPEVESGVNVWYTQKPSTLSAFLNVSKYILRDLYMSVYNNENTGADIDFVDRVSGRQFKLREFERNLSSRMKNKITLDMGKFIKNVLKLTDELMRRVPAVSTTDLTLNAYPFLQAVDMAYGKVWTFDNQRKQYYRIDGGRKVYYDEDFAGDARTCYATYLAKGNSEKCDRLIQCIIDGDVKSLSRCLHIIGDSDLWDVAEDDIFKVGPDKIRIVFKKFGISGLLKKNSEGISYKVPIPYEVWMRDIVENFDEDVRRTIKSNHKLLTYIRALITICRNNPSILNKDVAKFATVDNIPEYARNLNMKNYTIPASSKKSQLAFFAELLKNEQYPVYVNNDLWNPIVSGNMSNVSFFSPYVANPVNTMLMGGANGMYAINPGLPSAGTTNITQQFEQLGRTSSDVFTHLISSLVSSLNDVGIVMHDDDRKRLEIAVNKLKKYEHQLAKLCVALNNIAKLARFYGISLENVSHESKSILKLSDIHDWSDVTRFIRNYISEIKRNMLTNMTIQQSTAFELMSHISPRLMGSSDRNVQADDEQELVPI